MRNFISFLIIAIFSTVKAQNKPFEVALGWKGGGASNPIHVISVTDSASSKNCVIASRKSGMKAFLFDDNMHLLKEMTTNGYTDEVLGGFIEDQKIHVFLKSELVPSTLITNVVFNIKDGRQKNFKFPLRQKEKSC
jgi:hypothetical protein